VAIVGQRGQHREPAGGGAKFSIRLAHAFDGRNRISRLVSARLAATPLPLYLACLAGNALLPIAVGVVLVSFSHADDFVLLIPLGIGMGIIAYAVAVIVFTLLGLWRGRRAARRNQPINPPEQ